MEEKNDLFTRTIEALKNAPDDIETVQKIIFLFDNQLEELPEGEAKDFFLKLEELEPESEDYDEILKAAEEAKKMLETAPKTIPTEIIMAYQKIIKAIIIFQNFCREVEGMFSGGKENEPEKALEKIKAIKAKLQQAPKEIPKSYLKDIGETVDKLEIIVRQIMTAGEFSDNSGKKLSDPQ